jgi:CBS domain-containing protein
MEVAGTVSGILARKGDRVYSIGPDRTVFDALQLMADKNVGALMVVKDDRLLGVLSERDYSRKVILHGRSSKETLVREIMTPEPLVASPDEKITECMQLMTEHRVRHLPVLKDGRLVGVVSIGDLVNWMISAQAAAIDNLERYITGDYPA